jgi:hypothetical protein
LRIGYKEPGTRDVSIKTGQSCEEESYSFFAAFLHLGVGEPRNPGGRNGRNF